MAQQFFKNDYGFSFARTDLNAEVLVGQETAHDSIAWLDLDGDGHIDLIAITTQQGEEEDTDHELVALQIPTGKALWRALNGEVSQKVAVVDGVVIVSASNSNTLRGLNPSNGEQLWSLDLDDQLEGREMFDDDEVAAAITGRGAWAVFQCTDETAHVIEAKTGKLVKSVKGRLEHNWLTVPGLACFVVEEDDHKEKFIAWDIASQKAIFETTNDTAPAMGNEVFALLERDYRNDQTVVRVFDLNTLEETKTVVAATEQGKSLSQGREEYARQGALLLPGGHLIVGKSGEGEIAVLEMGTGPAKEPQAKKGFFSKLFGGGGGGGKKATARIVSPPKEGYGFEAFAIAGDSVAVAYRKTQGTEKIILVGYDKNTMEQRWVVENLGGRRTEVCLLSTGNALVVPKSQRPEDHHWHEGNQQSWWHINPADGSKVTEYPVAEIQCVEVHGKYFCAFAATYGSCLPVAYDTESRERVL